MESSQTFSDIYRDINEATFTVAYESITSLVSNWDRNKKILDIGFGAERSTKHLKALGFINILSIDEDWDMIAKAREPKNKIVQMNMCNLGFANNTFDYISVQNVLQDITNYKDLTISLQELSRITKPGGGMLIMNPTPASYLIETTSFDSSKFPENTESVKKGMGAEVKVKIKGNDEVFVDHVWRDLEFRQAFEEASLQVEGYNEPLGNGESDLISENDTPPHMLYKLKVIK